MNPMTNVRNIEKLNEEVLRQGITDEESWHKQYKDSAWIFIGGLPYDLTEGDILCVFSQYGEIVDINLVKEKTGKSKGFCFLCYEDQRSTILSVDNLNGIKLGGRTIRVDHCDNYRRPKSDEVDETGQKKEIISKGCAPQTPSSSEGEQDSRPMQRKKQNKSKKLKKPKCKDHEDQSDSDSEGDRTNKQFSKERKTEKYAYRVDSKFGHSRTDRDFKDDDNQRCYKSTTERKKEEIRSRDGARYNYEANNRYSKIEERERRPDGRNYDERGEKRGHHSEDKNQKYNRGDSSRYSRKEYRR